MTSNQYCEFCKKCSLIAVGGEMECLKLSPSSSLRHERSLLKLYEYLSELKVSAIKSTLLSIVSNSRRVCIVEFNWKGISWIGDLTHNSWALNDEMDVSNDDGPDKIRQSPFKTSL